jgi:hypothetical protein
MAKNNKYCPECGVMIPSDEMCFVAADEEGDYGYAGEFFRFHPACWAQGEGLGQLREHTTWLIRLTAHSLEVLRTEYPSGDVPECASNFMPELDQALVGLLEEAYRLRSVAASYQDNQPA